jgi:hypothetical protein
MTAAELRTDLLQQIEQADEKLLRIVSSVLEAVKVEYVRDVTEAEAEANYAKHLKPMTREEMTNELKEAMTDYEGGDYVTLEEMEKESATW